MNKRIKLTASVLALFLTLAIGIEIGSATEDKPYYQCAEEGGPFFIRIVSCSTVWATHHIEAIGIAITALATIVVAWFTGTLAKATNRLWIGSENQLKAAKGAQRGFLFPGKPTVSLEFSDAIPNGFHSVKLPVRHTGSSPVIFREIYWEFRDTEPTGSVANYRGGQVKNVDGAMDARVQERVVGPFCTTTTDAQYIVGIIRYLDAWKDQHESRFCFSIANDPGLVATSGSQAYNDWD